jgi:hypothetical protein
MCPLFSGVQRSHLGIAALAAGQLASEKLSVAQSPRAFVALKRYPGSRSHHPFLPGSPTASDRAKDPVLEQNRRHVWCD